MYPFYSLGYSNYNHLCGDWFWIDSIVFAMRVVSWFSCGATSAVASKLTYEKYREVMPVEIVYIDTHSEHPDNKRFLLDCQDWIGQEIISISSKTREDIWDVFAKDKYLVGARGARCSLVLKKMVRQGYEDLQHDLQVFGYDAGERKRSEAFMEHNPEIRTEFPLIDGGLTKQECLGMLARDGIEIPTMYQMGYQNNNCIGCVKGGAGYWNKIKKDFPEVYSRMSGVERQLGIAINKRYENGKRIKVFLSELPDDMGRMQQPLAIQCGLFCQELDAPKEGQESDDGL
jgi:hypothetical protein